MYSFTYKISLGMVLIRLFLNEIILIILIKLKLKIMEKKLFAIECGNVVLVVRPNGDTVIVTESNELVLDNAVMDQLVRNSGAYKSFVTTKDDVVAGLKRDNAELQNTIVGLREELEHVKGGDSDDVARLKRERIKLRNNIMGLKEELEHTKAAKDKLQQELDDVANGAQSMIKGCIVEAKAYRLYDINGNFLVDCGTNSRAARVQKLLKEGKINLDMVMTVFSSEDGKKRRADDVMVSSEE